MAEKVCVKCSEPIRKPRLYCDVDERCWRCSDDWHLRSEEEDEPCDESTAT